MKLSLKDSLDAGAMGKEVVLTLRKPMQRMYYEKCDSKTETTNKGCPPAKHVEVSTIRAKAMIYAAGAR